MLGIINEIYNEGVFGSKKSLSAISLLTNRLNFSM